MEQIKSKFKEIIEPTREKSELAFGLAEMDMQLIEHEDNKKILHYILYKISLCIIEMKDLINLLEDMQK
ncbi:MAG: hypothetical protein J6Q39_00475 [Bacteroidales bacterium]|nr:hypothetical protein [Bacteroidales bacterium]